MTRKNSKPLYERDNGIGMNVSVIRHTSGEYLVITVLKTDTGHIAREKAFTDLYDACQYAESKFVA